MTVIKKWVARYMAITILLGYPFAVYFGYLMGSDMFEKKPWLDSIAFFLPLMGFSSAIVFLMGAISPGYKSREYTELHKEVLETIRFKKRLNSFFEYVKDVAAERLGITKDGLIEEFNNRPEDVL